MLQIGFNKMTVLTLKCVAHVNGFIYTVLHTNVCLLFFSLFLNITTDTTTISNGSTAAEISIALIAASNANLLINNASLRCQSYTEAKTGQLLSDGQLSLQLKHLYSRV